MSSVDNVQFIDKFIVPEAAKSAFSERSIIARDFLRSLNGFLGDAGYERMDENGNLIFVSVAVWRDHESLDNAREAMQAEYRRQGFDPASFMQKLGITIDRGIYKKVY